MGAVTGMKGLKIKRVIRLVRGSDGRLARETLYKKGGRRKKQSKGLKDGEKVARRLARAYRRGFSTYLAKHKRSSRKRRDGWARDYGVNLFKANRRALKVLRQR